MEERTGDRRERNKISLFRRKGNYLSAFCIECKREVIQWQDVFCYWKTELFKMAGLCFLLFFRSLTEIVGAWML